MCDPGGAQLAPALKFPTSGTVNALIIFVQNYTDSGRDDCFDSTQPLIDFHQFPASTCQNRQDTPNLQSTTADPETEWPQGWSTGPDRNPPMWANTMLAAPGTLPSNFPTGSLSQFYHLNSGGRFALTGYVYPKVYIPAHEPLWYDDPANRGLFENGAVKLSHDVLTYVNANRHGIPLGDASIFDRYTNGTNSLVPDGKFDMVVMIFRSNKTCASQGGYGFPACGNAMTSLGAYFNAPDELHNSFSSSPIVFQGPGGVGGLSVIDNLVSGSGVWSAGSNMFLAQVVTVHEIGHRQFGLVHSEDNRLGVMGPSALHPTMFTAPDRVQLGWATEENVSYGSLATAANSRTLSETFESGTVLTVRSGSTPGDEYGDVIVEARTHTNVWDQPAGPSNPFSDGDITDFYLQREGLLVYKRGAGTNPTNYASSVENTGFASRGYPDGAFRGTIRVEYAAGNAYSPLTRMRFEFPQNTTLDRGFAITDIVRSGTGFSVSLWREFQTASGVKTVGTNYTLANHEAGITSGVAYASDRNVARQDDWAFGGTLRLDGSLGRVLGGTPTVSLLDNATLHVASTGRVTLRGPDGYTFPVTFGEGAKIEAYGELNLDRARLTSRTPSGRWKGAGYFPGATGMVTNTTIERVQGNGYALCLIDAAVTVSGSRVIDNQSHGVLIQGGAAAVLTANQVLRNTGSGVVVSGATGAVIENNFVRGSGASGLDFGTAGSARVRQNTVGGNAPGTGNGGYGIFALGSASPQFGRPSGLTEGVNLIEGNALGGIYSASGAVVYAGTGASTGGQNILRDNGQPGSQWDLGGGLGPDAEAANAGLVYARHNWWGRPTQPDTTSNRGSSGGGGTYYSCDPDGDGPAETGWCWDPGPITGEVSSGVGAGVLYVDPMLTQAPGAGASTTGGRAAREDDGVTTVGATGARAAETAEPAGLVTASGQGLPANGRATLRELLLIAREAADAGRTAEALTALQTVTERAPARAEAVAALGETGRLCAADPAALVALQVAAGGSGRGWRHAERRAWAQRALIVCHESTGQVAAALAVAAALSENRMAAHAAAGSLALVRLHMAAGRPGEATGALRALLALDASSEAVAAAQVLAAVTAGDDVLTGASASRGASPTPAEGLARAAGEAAGTIEASRLDVSPNPSSGRVSVSLTLSGPSRARVAVYDALGREVAVLLDGPLGGGAHTVRFDGVSLPGGVYVVRAAVTPEGGAAARALVRRVTLVR